MHSQIIRFSHACENLAHSTTFSGGPWSKPPRAPPLPLPLSEPRPRKPPPLIPPLYGGAPLPIFDAVD